MTGAPDRAELVAQLQALPMLRGLPPGVLTELARRAAARRYAPGQVLFLAGDVVPALFVVRAGWVKVARTSADGREQVLSDWGPGELFGGVGVFSDRPAPASATAMEATDVWVLPRAALHDLMAEHPALALRVLDFMAERLTELVDLVAELSLSSVRTRLARFLLDHADGDMLLRQRWSTQAELAARLGTVPDVLGRALRQLADDGLIELSRAHIRVLDRPGLKDRAAGG